MLLSSEKIALAAPKRVFWLGMHKVLSQTELPRLRSLGYEVFNPTYLSDVYDQSAVYDVPLLEGSTLPSFAIEILARTNFFYDEITDEAAEVLNEFFDAAIVTINPTWLTNFLAVFKGKVVYRVYGQPYALSESLIDTGAFRQIVERDNFWFSPHSEKVLDIEDNWLLDRMMIAPYCLTSDVVVERDTWELEKTCDEVGLLCPRAIDIPYYANNYRHLNCYFPGPKFKIFGMQNIKIDNDKVVGTLEREEFLSQFRRMRGFAYHYEEPTVCYLPPLEFMTLGGPVVFQGGSLLSRYFSHPAPGCAKDIDGLVVLSERLRRGDKQLSEEIVSSQREVRKLYQPEHVWPIFDKAMQHMLSSAGNNSASRILYAPSLIGHSGEGQKKDGLELAQNVKTVLMPFHGFGPLIIRRNGKYHCSEGIARVARLLVVALVEAGFRVVVTSSVRDVGRVYGFFVSEIQDPSMLKIWCTDSDKDRGGLYSSIKDMVVSKLSSATIQKLARVKLRICQYAQRIRFGDYRGKLTNYIRRLVAERKNRNSSLQLILAAISGLIFSMLVKPLLLIGYQIGKSLLKWGLLRRAEYVEKINNDSAIDAVLVPHYHMFPEIVRVTKKPVVLYLPDYLPHFYRNSIEMGATAKNRMIGKLLSDKASRIITNSAFTKEYLPSTDLRVDASKIVHLPLPFLNKHTAYPEGGVSQAVDALPKHFVFYPTRDRPSKRLKDFVKTIEIVNQRLIQDGREARIYGVLTSPLTIENMANEVYDNLVVLSEVSDEDLSQIYKKSLALLFTSELEGNFPTQVTEALFLRVPVVASAMPLITSELGETAEVLRLCQTGNCDAYANRVLEVLANRTDVIKRQEPARDFVIENFAIEKFEALVQEAFEQVIN